MTVTKEEASWLTGETSEVNDSLILELNDKEVVRRGRLSSPKSVPASEERLRVRFLPTVDWLAGGSLRVTLVRKGCACHAGGGWNAYKDVPSSLSTVDCDISGGKQMWGRTWKWCQCESWE